MNVSTEERQIHPERARHRRRFSPLRLIASLALLLVLLVFALSNRQAVVIDFWPTGISVTMQLSLAILLGAAIAFVAGAFTVWVSHFGLSRRAKKAEMQVKLLMEQLKELRSGHSPEVLPPPDV